MASILVNPLSVAPRNAVCGLIRLITTMPSADAAYASMCTGVSSLRCPTTTVSMVALIGTPMVSSVIPYPASTSFCPLAVAAPWLPMHGKMNGLAPRSSSSLITDLAITLMFAIPRLPQPTAITWPALIFSRISGFLNASPVAWATS